MSEGQPFRDARADEHARQLEEQRLQAWSNYLKASAGIADSRIQANLTGWKRWLHHLPGASIDKATARRDALRRELSEHGVGADDRLWGVLSGARVRSLGTSVCLETTIADLVREYEPTAPHWTRQLERVAQAAGEARPLAATGDRAVVAEVIEQLLPVTRIAPDEQARQRLTDHLPGTLRPVPADITTLRRSDTLVEVVFDIYADTIKLDNITVNPELRGTGLGSAVLAHLCRSADAHHLYIVGQLVPTFRDDDSAVPRLADWCRRHGFSVNERLGGRIVRSPASVGA
ncbi:hypothetical protein [Nocardia huaxiensis]|uniref:N-acetyltransferase domain-containing protein n=1 Tax=Nocardia huaxiensis TaxID=2755382 RepID=A0A7D6Z5Z0_9NOCA|nr:hypothetical protein [Nocardia huaxiensis]QLY33906.1 hypothetical protein H0264_18215 [Nocardia huaxiensis]UFS99160.1 hypothetical protein LPY97_15300 [Nocardia huaxiensis]